MTGGHGEPGRAARLRLLWLSGGDDPIAAAVASPEGPSQVGAVIVPSIGHEANLMQPAIADLARALATAGVHAVAVQIAGVDQSHGTLRTPELVTEWRASVDAGLAHIRAMGVPKPYLIACRLGATLLSEAVVASASGVVLWSPTTRGRRLVRELRLLQAGADYAGDRSDEVNVAGYAFPNELLEGIAALRLDAGELRRATRVLILDDEHRPCDPAFIDALTGSPCDVTHERVDDLDSWVDVDPDVSTPPLRSVGLITDWILDPRYEPGSPPPISGSGVTGEVTAVVDGVSEEFVTIGERGLAGVYHHGDDPMRPALLIVSTAGPGRQFLELAREEARTGRTVLRFDFAGTGWSDPSDDGAATFAYDERSVGDVVAAADWLAAQTSGPTVAIGFCAGGRALVEAAADAAYDHVVAFNVELFEPMSSAPARPNGQGGRRLAVLTCKLWRAIGHRRRTRITINRAIATGSAVRLVYHRSELALRYLRTLRRGRSVLAGRHEGVSVKVLDSLGHNLEGPQAAEAIGEVRALLERLDRSDATRTQRRGSGAARAARRLGATVAIAALDLTGGSVVPLVPDSEVAAEHVEAAEGHVRHQRQRWTARRRPHLTSRRTPGRWVPHRRRPARHHVSRAVATPIAPALRARARPGECPGDRMRGRGRAD